MLDDTHIDYKQVSLSLLEAFPLPVFVVDRSLTIIHYNQPGLSLSATNSRSATQLEQIIFDPSIIEMIRESIATNHPQKSLFEKTNTDLAWKVSVAPLIHQTGAELPHYFTVIIEDITEARRVERMQRDFLANISHELRTPLTSVRLLAETLEDTIETNPDKAQEFVEKIENEVQYLTELVSEVLELTRIESGQMLMTIEPIEAERLVLEVMARMLPLAQRHRVTLSTQIQQGTTMVAADSKHITRVLVNLVHNAIKFTPSGGKIVIGTAPQQNQPSQSFFVRDTGVGIRAEELSRIFERFYKTDRARSKSGFIGPGGGGTGLGLAIARHVVEAHGGRIHAESRPGEGSTFTFTLPVAVQSTIEMPESS
ncbi:sensor histidine kinase [Tengunoibacter tsumagoiensis]|uniref:histidine kinase n=1 Tax=Tengunoibacter tsumagoiensis TaxID=2014871 RepID=A0A401ZVL4_9CHLR|nr:ATP-binding protein [Tengunoibacter tsumagoiensis]GCE10836.1 PAS domain-containing sensor histidine kinase [Tengunoibacter tsumagoiensis]